MVRFQVDSGERRVVLDLKYSVLGANTWTEDGGDSSILAVGSGKWTFASGPYRRLKIQNEQEIDLAYLDGVKDNGVFDPLGNVSVGDAGEGDLLGLDAPVGIQWTVVAT